MTEPMSEPKSTVQLLREYSQIRVFDATTFKRARLLMANAADELEQLEARVNALVSSLMTANSWLRHYGHGEVAIPGNSSQSETKVESLQIDPTWVCGCNTINAAGRKTCGRCGHPNYHAPRSTSEPEAKP